MRRADQGAFDGALVGLGFLAVVIEGLSRDWSTPALLPAVAAVTCAPLLWRNRAPMATLLAVGAGAVACVTVFHTYDSATAVFLFPLYTVAATGNRRRTVLVGAVTTIVLVIIGWVIEPEDSPRGGAILVFLALAVLTVGDRVRSRAARQTPSGGQ